MMDIDSAATFFVGSILVCAGMLVIAGMIVLLNNVFSRYWKPVTWTVFKYHPTEIHFLDPKIEESGNNSTSKT
jgi:hypothetical protein